MTEARCSSCKRPIEWAITAKKLKSIPLDVGEDLGGNLKVIDGVRHEGQIVVEYVRAGAGNRVTHFATCPSAKAFRR